MWIKMIRCKEISVISFVFISLFAISSAVLGFGSGCNSASDCDNTKGLTCLFLYGPTCTKQGRCDCSSTQTWSPSTSQCTDGTGVGDTCRTDADCSSVITIDGSGNVGKCNGGKCACPNNYYQLSSSKFQCANTPGFTAMGSICASQSQCGQNMICSYCPGDISGSKFCFGFSQGLGNFGEGCNSDSGCNSATGLSCLMLYGPTCNNKGRCDCTGNQVFSGANFTCVTAPGLGDNCTVQADCNHIAVRVPGSTSRLASTCSQGKCTCPTNYDKIQTNKFQCTKGQGSLAQGDVCGISQNPYCGNNLICTTCPGAGASQQYCFGFTAGKNSFGQSCDSDADCDTTKSLKCSNLYGPSCSRKGRCVCGSNNQKWDPPSSTCMTRVGLQGTCTTATDCSNIDTLPGGGSVKCNGGKCVCPIGYYQLSTFQCAKGPGNTPQGGNCTNQSQCGRNLLCTTCPGFANAASGIFSTYCFGSSALQSFGGGCNVNADCNSVKGLVCQKVYGKSTCTYKGRCVCGSGSTWLAASDNCGSAKGLGDACMTTQQCNNVVTFDGSGIQGICVTGKCACPTNYYQFASNKFQCANSVGTATLGSSCTSQGQCGRNLRCSYCPGQITGSQSCFGFAAMGTASTFKQSIWSLLIAYLTTAVFTQLK